MKPASVGTWMMGGVVARWTGLAVEMMAFVGGEVVMAGAMEAVSCFSFLLFFCDKGGCLGVVWDCLWV